MRAVSAGEVKQAISIDIADEGLAATHPLDVDFPRAMATNQPGSSDHNSLRDFLVVVGCAMFPDVTFQFDSSLVGPEVRKATRRLAAFREQLKAPEGLRDANEPAVHPPLALFGHADPVGQFNYNSRLSARRALCIYGMLLRRVDIWEGLFSDKSVSGDVWSDPEFDTMLDEVGFEPELPKDSTDEAQRQQVKARLKASAGDRARLFAAYMDAVCVQEGDDGNDAPFVLQASDFLDRGESADHKAAVQGCGEFNPVLILSRAKQNAFEASGDKEGRDAANEPNRRVLCFMFKPGTRIVLDHWPCPIARDAKADATCRKRLWHDADRRMAPDPNPDKTQAKDRKFKDTTDTFGCRFYHAFAQNSPCEGTLKLWVLRLGFSDRLRQDENGQDIEDEKGRNQLRHPLARRRYVLEAGEDPGTPVIRGRTDEGGGIRVPVFDERATMTLRLDLKSLFDPEDPASRDKASRKQAEDSTPEEEFLPLKLLAGDLLPMPPTEDGSADPLAVRQRLSNLSYGPDRPVVEWTDQEQADAITAFERAHKLEPTGQINAPLTERLRKVHGS